MPPIGRHRVGPASSDDATLPDAPKAGEAPPEARCGKATGAAGGPGSAGAAPAPVTAATTAPADGAESTVERLKLRLLGDAYLALDATRRARVLGWVFPLLVMVAGGALRFWRLGVPHSLVFDETYYVKDGYSLMVHGYEANWGNNPNPGFESGNTSMLQSSPEFVVHPPMGKWLIGLGIRAGGGVDSSFAWRLAAAVCGTLAILLIARIARRLFASTALGVVAGIFLAVDGEALVQSRTSLLDPFLMFWVLVAFGALVMDRFWFRRRLAERAAAVYDAGNMLAAGPGVGFRWWRLAAAVALGLACGTKWSGIYFVAVFGVMTVWWDVSARRAVGVGHWLRTGALRDGIPAFLLMVPGTALVYLGTWTGWLFSSNGWDRQWAADNPGQGIMWLPPALRSLWKNHTDMWQFNITLSTPHPYAANPLGWILQYRPTSFFYPTSISGLSGQDAINACGATSCSQPITSLGNPLIWWAGALAMFVALYWLIRHRDWRAGAALSGIAAGWLPWFMYLHRTIFTFYSVAFVPWVIFTLVYVLGLIVGRPRPGEERARRWAIRGVIAFVVIVVGVGAFFYPIWTAQVISYQQWHIRMWLQSWI